MINIVEEGLEMIQQGRVVIVVDDMNRENEGDFIVSGEKITPEIVNFMITYGKGLLCAPLPRSRCEELELYPMTQDNTSILGTPFTMSVDLRGYGCTTGVSACDRSATIRALVSGDIEPAELARPGHVFPLCGKDNEVLERDGHTEALLDMTRIAGLKLGGALIEILNEDGTMARLPQLIEIAKRFRLKIISINDIQEYRKTNNI
ncbi:MAG: 3,4-dihydroxy-2-butanone-4-phosphate synthase [Prevotellaceae bacterium]|jgi:3,4-dihydroxy 2-butanone 4-phosphate synthase/GTP cyclohydrolase II|nr:3,4-dihydroxy-2-butanone-4-phosphate synthase [Prevotellaceae bacterium]